MRNVADKTRRENQNTFCVQELFCENHAFHEKMWKNIVERVRPQMTVLYGASTSPVGWLRLQTHSQNLQDILLLHGDNSYTNAPLNYVYTYIAFLFGFIRMNTRKQSRRCHDHILPNTCLSPFTVTSRMI